VVDCDLDEASNPKQSPSSTIHILKAGEGICVSRESQGCSSIQKGDCCNRAGPFEVRSQCAELIEREKRVGHV